MPFDPKKLASNVADLAGVSISAPSSEATSSFAQTAPGVQEQMANPLSPIMGDQDFYTYMIPGAVFEANDGSQWLITAYEWDGRVELENRWYPRMIGNVSVNDVRRSIAMWIEPVNVKVPPPLPNINYVS
jgi:hypothetical protein